MTTIATDGKTIAADGRATRGWEIVADDVQKIFARNGCVYAFSGADGMYESLMAWHQSGHNPRDVPACTVDGGWSMLVIDWQGTRRFINEAPYPCSVSQSYTMGSGRDFARAAMLCGKSPREAVEIAIRCDAASGGTITEIDIAEVLGTKLKEAVE